MRPREVSGIEVATDIWVPGGEGHALVFYTELNAVPINLDAEAHDGRQGMMAGRDWGPEGSGGRSRVIFRAGVVEVRILGSERHAGKM